MVTRRSIKIKISEHNDVFRQHMTLITVTESQCFLKKCFWLMANVSFEFVFASENRHKLHTFCLCLFRIIHHCKK